MQNARADFLLTLSIGTSANTFSISGRCEYSEIIGSKEAGRICNVS